MTHHYKLNIYVIRLIWLTESRTKLFLVISVSCFLEPNREPIFVVSVILVRFSVNYVHLELPSQIVCFLEYEQSLVSMFLSSLAFVHCLSLILCSRLLVYIFQVWVELAGGVDIDVHTFISINTHTILF